jgi:cell division protein FtsL
MATKKKPAKSSKVARVSEYEKRITLMIMVFTALSLIFFTVVLRNY